MTGVLSAANEQAVAVGCPEPQLVSVSAMLLPISVSWGLSSHLALSRCSVVWQCLGEVRWQACRVQPIWL